MNKRRSRMRHLAVTSFVAFGKTTSGMATSG